MKNGQSLRVWMVVMLFVAGVQAEQLLKAQKTITINYTTTTTSEVAGTNRDIQQCKCWELRDQDNHGALHGMPLQTNEVIQWIVKGSAGTGFSIALTNYADWVLPTNSPNRLLTTNLPAPFNGVANAVVANGNWAVILQRSPTSSVTATLSYFILVPPLSTTSTNDGKRDVTAVANYSIPENFEMVEATLVWNGAELRGKDEQKK